MTLSAGLGAWTRKTSFECRLRRIQAVSGRAMACVILSNALRLPLRRPTPSPIVVSERHAALHALACTLWSRGVGSGDLDVSISLLRRGMKTKTYMEHVGDNRAPLTFRDATSSR